MGKVFEGIDGKLAAWIAAQPLFFVGTAPESGGHVNVSPKGPIASLAVLGPRTIAYLDLIGSGAETAAHLRDNGRICVMLCAFQGPPRVLRMHGTGRVVEAGSSEYDGLAVRFEDAAIPGAQHASRSVIVVELDRIADSCGYDVPLMTPTGGRTQREAWVASKRREGDDALPAYVAARNAESIDGLPAFGAERA
jgi:hypothetical protein